MCPDRRSNKNKNAQKTPPRRLLCASSGETQVSSINGLMRRRAGDWLWARGARREHLSGIKVKALNYRFMFLFFSFFGLRTIKVYFILLYIIVHNNTTYGRRPTGGDSVTHAALLSSAIFSVSDTVPRPMGWAYSVSSYSCLNMPSAHWSQNRIDSARLLPPRTGLWEPISFHTDAGGYLLRQYRTSRGVTNRRYITSWDENGL